MVKEDTRAVWGWIWVDRVGRDVRHAVRSVLNRPGFLVTTTVTLALGIGLTSFMFSVVYGVILRGLPFDDAEDLLSVNPYRTVEGELAPLRVHDFLDWREQQTGFEDLAAFYLETVNISDTGERPIRFQGMHFSAGLLRAFNPGFPIWL